MDWEVVRSAFVDELEKIAEFNLQGVKAETAMEASQPLPPMPSAAYDTAQRVLDRRDALMGKEASEDTTALLSNPVLKNRAKSESSTPQPMRDAKSLGAHAVGGSAIGALAGRMSFLPGSNPSSGAMHNRTWAGTAIGAGLGAAEYGRKKLMTKKKQSSAVTPGTNLKASQQVGSFSTAIHSTPSANAQVPGKIGRKGDMP